MKTLFDKTNLLNMKLKNRFFRGGLWEELADEKGHMTEALFKIYEELAEGGVALIITGYAHVLEEEQPNPGMMGIYSDIFIDEYKKFTDMVHSNDANIIMQIAYGGSQTRFNVENRVIWGPSAVAHKGTGTIPKEITKDEIRYLTKAYGDAALRIKKSGFDGVELHSAHGYFLSQFLSPYYNRRADEYGGTIENRARIIFEIYESMRSAVGEDFPILIKINSEDFMDDGLTQEDSLYVTKKLAELGINAIEVSGGTGASYENKMPSRTKIFKAEDQSYFREYAKKLADATNIPIILIGGNRDLDTMESLLNQGIDYFSLARPLTAEPDLINKWASGDRKKTKCVSCNACYNTPGKRCILNIKGK